MNELFIIVLGIIVRACYSYLSHRIEREKMQRQQELQEKLFAEMRQDKVFMTKILKILAKQRREKQTTSKTVHTSHKPPVVEEKNDSTVLFVFAVIIFILLFLF